MVMFVALYPVCIGKITFAKFVSQLVEEVVSDAIDSFLTKAVAIVEVLQKASIQS